MDIILFKLHIYHILRMMTSKMCVVFYIAVIMVKVTVATFRKEHIITVSFTFVAAFDTLQEFGIVIP